MVPKPFKPKGKRHFYFWYRDSAGQRKKKSTGETRVTYAQKYIERYTRHLGYVPSLSEFASDFFDHNCQYVEAQREAGKRFSERHRENRRYHLSHYIMPKWGGARLDEINRRDVRNWLLALKKDSGKALSNQTKNHILHTFRTILREARDAGYMDHAVLDDLKPFSTRGANKRDVFTSGEWHKLFPFTPELIEAHLKRRRTCLRIWQSVKYYCLGYLLATAGLRVGEAVSLKWGAVLDDTWLYVLQSKTGTAKLVYLPEMARELLQLWRGQARWTEPEDFIFYGRSRYHHVFNTTVSKLVSHAIDRAGIKRGERILVAHSLRHSYNTMLRRQVPDDALRIMTGHATAAMTEAYDHPRVDELKKALKPHTDSIERALR